MKRGYQLSSIDGDGFMSLTNLQTRAVNDSIQVPNEGAIGKQTYDGFRRGKNWMIEVISVLGREHSAACWESDR